MPREGNSLERSRYNIIDMPYNSTHPLVSCPSVSRCDNCRSIMAYGGEAEGCVWPLPSGDGRGVSFAGSELDVSPAAAFNCAAMRARNLDPSL